MKIKLNAKERALLPRLRLRVESFPFQQGMQFLECYYKIVELANQYETDNKMRITGDIAKLQALALSKLHRIDLQKFTNVSYKLIESAFISNLKTMQSIQPCERFDKADVTTRMHERRAKQAKQQLNADIQVFERLAEQSQLSKALLDSMRIRDIIESKQGRALYLKLKKNPNSAILQAGINDLRNYYETISTNLGRIARNFFDYKDARYYLPASTLNTLSKQVLDDVANIKNPHLTLGQVAELQRILAQREEATKKLSETDSIERKMAIRYNYSLAEMACLLRKQIGKKWSWRKFKFIPKLEKFPDTETEIKAFVERRRQELEGVPYVVVQDLAFFLTTTLSDYVQTMLTHTFLAVSRGLSQMQATEAREKATKSTSEKKSN